MGNYIVIYTTNTMKMINYWVHKAVVLIEKFKYYLTQK